MNEYILSVLDIIKDRNDKHVTRYFDKFVRIYQNRFKKINVRCINKNYKLKELKKEFYSHRSVLREDLLDRLWNKVVCDDVV